MIHGIRYAQVKAYDGSVGLANSLCQSLLGQRFHLGQEEFWATVIQWFCNQAMMEYSMVGPAIDFIHNQRELVDGGYSIKGRTATSVIRAMEQWHRVLAKVKDKTGTAYTPSGYIPGTWVTHKTMPDGVKIPIATWEVTEVLSSKALIAEGRDLKHCVYSYSTNIKNGLCSIWSLKENGKRRVTIEVRSGSVFQARGSCNMPATGKQKGIIKKWAAKNGISIRRFV